jgi:Eukaryotic cytochrome b561
MVITFGCIVPVSLTSYRVLKAGRAWQKRLHMLLHSASAVLSTIGIVAMFRFHKEKDIPDLYSVHSWLGIIVYIGFICTYVASFLLFWWPQLASRQRDAPAIMWVHRTGGSILFIGAICTMLMGLQDKQRLLAADVDKRGGHYMSINTLALLLFSTAAAVGVYFQPLSASITSTRTNTHQSIDGIRSSSRKLHVDNIVYPSCHVLCMQLYVYYLTVFKCLDFAMIVMYCG